MTQDLQKTWDACMIRCWRKFLTIGDAIAMYRSMTGAYPTGLLRVPNSGLHYKIGIKVFMDSYLPKINSWLWSNDPDKDILLLRKLQNSKYDCSKRPHTTKAKKDLENTQRKLRNNVSKVKLDIHRYSERNHATDWNVHK